MIGGVRRVTAITAIVHSADGIRFMTADIDREAVVARVAEYIRGRCDDVLWADAASQVRRMLNDGDLDAAIALYFGRVGERWDMERLELEPVEFDGADQLVRAEVVAHGR